MDQLAITLDTDWAPDFVIEDAARLFEAAGVRATWFITHQGKYLDRLRSRPDLFELGIHPNFMPGSTHGESPEQVLQHCLEIVPEAESVRPHGLFQSSSLMIKIMAQKALRTDVSLFLPGARWIEPVPYYWNQRSILRIPFFWEDDFEMEAEQPRWHPAQIDLGRPGLKVFNFHPIHVYLNSASAKPYEALKQLVPDLKSAEKTQVNKHVQHGEGARSMLKALINVAKTGENSQCIRDIRQRWQDDIGDIVLKLNNSE